MNILLIFNRPPYDGTDVTWNGLRLCGTLLENDQSVRIFLMNDAVDLAREACVPPDGSFPDLKKMLKELVVKGVTVKVCGTCLARCGLHKNHPYYDGTETSNMQALAEWVIDSDRVISF